MATRAAPTDGLVITATRSPTFAATAWVASTTAGSRVAVWRWASSRPIARLGHLRSMSDANALVVLAHERGDVAAGDEVDA